MNDCRIEFLKWAAVSKAPEARPRLCRQRVLGRDGGELRVSEAAARALARSIAREQQTGARVLGTGRPDLAWFVWVPSKREVVEVPVGTEEWRQTR